MDGDLLKTLILFYTLLTNKSKTTFYTHKNKVFKHQLLISSQKEFTKLIHNCLIFKKQLH